MTELLYSHVQQEVQLLERNVTAIKSQFLSTVSGRRKAVGYGVVRGSCLYALKQECAAPKRMIFELFQSEMGNVFKGTATKKNVRFRHRLQRPAEKFLENF